jgi:hypothetical protein
VIIRHPLQNFNNFIRAYHICHYIDRQKFMSEHIELFNNIDFVRRFCTYYPRYYQYIPIRFKSNKRVLHALLEYDQHMLKYAPDEAISNKKIIMYAIKRVIPHCPLYIYRYLSYELRKDPEIVACISAAFWLFDDHMGVPGLHSIPPSIYYHVVNYIPDDLINNRDFLLSICKFMPNNCSKSLSLLYSHTSIELKRDYEILLQMGYKYIGHKKTIYNEIMTSQMKSDTWLHRKLVKLNPDIYDFMPAKLKNKIPKK